MVHRLPLSLISFAHYQQSPFTVSADYTTTIDYYSRKETDNSNCPDIYEFRSVNSTSLSKICFNANRIAFWLVLKRAFFDKVLLMPQPTFTFSLTRGTFLLKGTRWGVLLILFLSVSLSLSLSLSFSLLFYISPTAKKLSKSNMYCTSIQSRS